MGVARILMCMAALALPASEARAQDNYPNRPIRVIMPVGAGAGVDTAARLTAAAAEWWSACFSRCC
jgi:tripartite-type tricarboxylate transporter receptor subunit TctC